MSEYPRFHLWLADVCLLLFTQGESPLASPPTAACECLLTQHEKSSTRAGASHLPRNSAGACPSLRQAADSPGRLAIGWPNPGSTPLRPWPSTGSPPFPLLRLGCTVVAFNPYADQPGLPAPGPQPIEDTGGKKNVRASLHHWGGVKRPIRGYTKIEMPSLAGSCGPSQGGERHLSEPHTLTGSWMTRPTCGSQCS